MQEHRMTLRLSNDARIEFVADNWTDAFKAYWLMRRLIERAERTAELMGRVKSMSSQCIQDYLEVKSILDYHAAYPGRADREHDPQGPQR